MVKDNIKPVFKERFRVSGKITRLLGSESVSDKTTALQEVLKNSHDADSLFVELKFEDFEIGTPRILIREEKGDGMTYGEIKNNFLVIGTYAKQPIEEKARKTNRLHRSMVGQKGVGRFALEKLGKVVTIISKPIETFDKFTFTIDWRKFESPEVTVDQIPIKIEKSKRSDKEDSGLEIEIFDLNEEWTKETLTKFEEDIKSLILPKQLQPKNAFNVYLEANYFGIPRHLIEVKLEEKAFYSLEAHLKQNKIIVNANKLGKNYIINKEITEFNSYVFPNKSRKVSELQCGPVKIFVHYFPQWQKGDKLANDYYNKAIKYYGEKLHNDIPELLEDYHGVRIYKDGLREFNYGDTGFDFTERETISRNLSGTMQAERLIGYCMISGQRNPGIKSTTNRREAIQNEAFLDLKDFVIASMLELDRKIHNERRAKLKALEDSKKPTIQNLKKVERIFIRPKVAKALEVMNQVIEQETGEKIDLPAIISKSREVAEEKEQSHDEIMTTDEITLANASVGDYLGRLHHDFVVPVVKMMSSSIARLHLIEKKIGNSELKEISHELESHWKMIRVVFDAVEGLNTGLAVEDYYKREKKKIVLKDEIEKVCSGLKLLLEFDDFKLENQVHAKLELDIFGPVIYSLLYNLLSNSIKALKYQKKKDEHGNFISIKTKVDSKHLIIFFSDNSTEGIPKNKWQTVFQERISSTSKNKFLPGHGIGLYIVRRMLTYVKGNISIVEPDYGKGTRFKIEFPYDVVGQD